MPKLVWAFAGRTYHIVWNLMSQLILFRGWDMEAGEVFIKSSNPIPYRAASAVKVNVLLADKLNQWHQIKYDVWKRHDCNAPKIHSYFIRLDMKSLNTDKLGTIIGASRTMNNSSSHFLITLFDLISALTPIGTHLVNYIYCKFGNFHEGFIFTKLRRCEVSWK